MTSPVGIVGLTYAGSDIQLANLTVFFEIRRGLNEVPSVRGRDITVPALAGRISRSRINDILPLELYGWVTTDPAAASVALSKASYRDNWQVVRALFASNRNADWLVATLEDGTEQMIFARPMNIAVAKEMPGWLALVSVELEGLGDWEPVAPQLLTPGAATLTLTTFAPTVTSTG